MDAETTQTSDLVGASRYAQNCRAGRSAERQEPHGDSGKAVGRHWAQVALTEPELFKAAVRGRMGRCESSPRRADTPDPCSDSGKPVGRHNAPLALRRVSTVLPAAVRAVTSRREASASGAKAAPSCARNANRMSGLRGMALSFLHYGSRGASKPFKSPHVASRCSSLPARGEWL